MPEPKPRDVWHEVQPDENVQLLALDYGIKDWPRVYDHPKNADLRARRPNPNVLYRGDRVWIPELEPAVHELATNEEHTLTLHPPRLTLRFPLASGADASAVANLRYEAWCDGVQHAPETPLRTTSSGEVDVQVPVARRIELKVWFGGDQEAPGSLVFLPGHLDPVDTPEGVHDRLTNLSYGCGDDPPDRPGEATRDALAEFQADQGLPATGEADEATRRALERAHGS